MSGPPLPSPSSFEPPSRSSSGPPSGPSLRPPSASWHLGLSVPGGLGRVSGGTLYDRHLVGGLRELGARVNDVPFLATGYLAMFLENLRPPPRPPCRVWLQDELGHPGFLCRQERLQRRGVSGAGPAPHRVALVHNLRSSLAAADRAETPLGRLTRIAVARLERTYLAGVSAWVAVCHDTLEDLQRLVGDAAARPSLVLYPGKDHAPTTRDDHGEDGAVTHGEPLRLLLVANVAPHKGVHRLLEILAATPALRAATLKVVGACAEAAPYVARLRRLCQARGLEGRVRFSGVLTGDALWDAYRNTDVFVLPSDREAYPLTAVEALGFGLPVVLTDRGGTRELVTHGREGFLLAPHDARAWVEALTHLAQDPAARRRHGRAARARHEHLPRWRDTAATLLAFFSDVFADATALSTRDGRAND